VSLRTSLTLTAALLIVSERNTNPSIGGDDGTVRVSHSHHLTFASHLLLSSLVSHDRCQRVKDSRTMFVNTENLFRSLSSWIEDNMPKTLFVSENIWKGRNSRSTLKMDSKEATTASEKGNRLIAPPIIPERGASCLQSRSSRRKVQCRLFCWEEAEAEEGDCK
jgi:hypothetical protein